MELNGQEDEPREFSHRIEIFHTWFCSRPYCNHLPWHTVSHPQFFPIRAYGILLQSHHPYSFSFIHFKSLKTWEPHALHLHGNPLYLSANNVFNTYETLPVPLNVNPPSTSDPTKHDIPPSKQHEGDSSEICLVSSFITNAKRGGLKAMPFLQMKDFE